MKNDTPSRSWTILIKDSYHTDTFVDVYTKDWEDYRQ